LYEIQQNKEGESATVERLYKLYPQDADVADKYRKFSFEQAKKEYQDKNFKAALPGKHFESFSLCHNPCLKMHTRASSATGSRTATTTATATATATATTTATTTTTTTTTITVTSTTCSARSQISQARWLR
jgi:hypothetical protein